MIDKYKYPLPAKRVISPCEHSVKEKEVSEIQYTSLKDLKVEKIIDVSVSDEAHYMKRSPIDEHRRALEAAMRLPSHLVVSQKGDLARAYRHSIDPDLDIHKWAFLFEGIHDELKTDLVRHRVEKRRDPIPYVPPVDETFLKEIAKQVWASVLPENRE